jgi:hypothetical protein
MAVCSACSLLFGKARNPQRIRLGWSVDAGRIKMVELGHEPPMLSQVEVESIDVVSALLEIAHVCPHR